MIQEDNQSEEPSKSGLDRLTPADTDRRWDEWNRECVRAGLAPIPLKRIGTERITLPERNDSDESAPQTSSDESSEIYSIREAPFCGLQVITRFS